MRLTTDEIAIKLSPTSWLMAARQMHPPKKDTPIPEAASIKNLPLNPINSRGF